MTENTIIEDASKLSKSSKTFGQLIKKKRRLWLAAIGAALLLWYTFCLPSPLFKNSYSTLLISKDGELLSASIARDGQWRFPASDSIPLKFEQCLINFEDKAFYWHPGVNPMAISRAIVQNFKHSKRMSGGSTITMQVLRLARPSAPRNFREKLLEMILATRLELGYSKREILALWCDHAPFGGNVVGLEAASWRYFGRSPEKLSWAESATLAVLPNAPALIFPGKNQHLLKKKRDRLLLKMHRNGLLKEEDYQLAVSEPLPQKPFPLPREAAHMLETAKKEGWEGRRLHSSLDATLQKRVEERLGRFYQLLYSNKVENACALIAEVETGKVVAYAGNIPSGYILEKEANSGYWIDLVKAKRSYGSLLKPFLYAHSLEEGLITPKMLLADHPSIFGGYQPHNFSDEYEGAVPANRALARSLNVPFVKLLQDYNTGKFQYRLKQWGIRSLNKPASHYGLSLILGGGEASLWEMAGAYASMARVLGNGQQRMGNYLASDVHRLSYLNELKNVEEGNVTEKGIISRPSLYLTFEALREAERPGMETSWMSFTSSRSVGWKTGTSYGFRDAWCIGVTPKYVVAIWVGNASGEGRPGLTGVGVAAPLMFDLFSLLPPTPWFQKPWKEWNTTSVCQKSGYIPGPDCKVTDTVKLPLQSVKAGICPFHHPVHLTGNGSYRANVDCMPVGELKDSSWFVLPPLMEYYYRQKDPTYLPLPPFLPICFADEQRHNLDFIYPRNNTRIFLTRQEVGENKGFVAEIAHRKPERQIHWHLDGSYQSTTTNTHQLLIEPSPGKHKLTAVDEQGETISVWFEVLNE